MDEPWFYAVWTLGAYLLGTVPAGHIVARAAGADIRHLGTGNPGTANVFREVGPGPGAAVLMLDVAKGVAVTVPLYLLERPVWAVTLAAAAALAAHFRPLIPRYPGGTGMAVGMGAAFGLLPIGALVAAPLSAVTVAATRNAGHSGGLYFAVTMIAGGLVHRDAWGVAGVLLLGAAILVRAGIQYRGR